MFTFSPLVKLAAFGLAAILTAGAVACGDDDDRPPTATPTTQAAATATPAGGNGDDAEAIEVVAIDYSFQNIPATISSGSTFALVNNSTIEAHEIVAIRLPDDETRPVAEILQLPEEELGELGEIQPSFVIIARPNGGEGETVLGDAELTETGRYLLACFIPIGADPDEYFEASEGAGEAPVVEGGPPHFTMGMFAEATVQ